MAKLGQVMFDVKRNAKKIGKRWFKGRKLVKKEVVRLTDGVTIKGRCEVVISGRCNGTNSLLTGNFEGRRDIEGCFNDQRKFK